MATILTPRVSVKHATTKGKSSPSHPWNTKKYFVEKSKGLKMPTDKASELKPVFMFEDPAIVIHMCAKCRRLNRTLEVVKVNEEYQQIPLTLCKICCATLNGMRRVKFFNHDLLCVKREEDVRIAMEEEKKKAEEIKLEQEVKPEDKEELGGKKIKLGEYEFEVFTID